MKISILVVGIILATSVCIYGEPEIDKKKCLDIHSKLAEGVTRAYAKVRKNNGNLSFFDYARYTFELNGICEKFNDNC